MIINAEKELKGLDGSILKNPFNPNKKDQPLTLGALIIHVLTVESYINAERSGYKEVNKKEGSEKFEDYQLALKVKGECDLDKDDVTRIKKLSHFLDTELYGILHFELQNGVPFPSKDQKTGAKTDKKS
jgi:hypothetical protein